MAKKYDPGKYERKTVSRRSKRYSIEKTLPGSEAVWDKTDNLESSDWELFDMENDRTEMHDLASENTKLVAKMADMWLAWGKRTGIVPRPKQ